MRSATTTYTAAERSPWRWPAAAAALTMTAAHIPVTAGHLSEAPYIGWSFVALEVAGFALAVVLVLRDTRRVWCVAAVVPALAMLAYVVTRSVALPQIADDVGNWVEPLGLVALAAEALLVAIALAHGVRATPPTRVPPNPVVLAVVVLAVGLAATGYASRHGEGMAGTEGGQGMGSMTSTLPPLQWTSFTDWHVRPWWLLFSGVVLAVYLGAVGVARRHGVRAVHPARVASFVAGIAVLLFTVSSAIDGYAMALFWDHMIEHLLLIMVVPALLVLGSPLSAVRAAAATQGSEGSVDAFARSWPVSVLSHAVVGLGIFAAVIVGTHLTGFMDAMAAHGWVMEAEQWLYLVTGFVYLLPLLGAEPIRSRPPYLGRLGLLLIGMTADTVVGIVLMQTNHNMFPVMEGAHPSWAPSPVQDLQMGGALMWVGGDGLMMLFGVGVTIAMITHTGSESVIGLRLEAVRRRTLADRVAMTGSATAVPDDADIDDDDAMLDAYNQMLARMNGEPAQPPPER